MGLTFTGVSVVGGVTFVLPPDAPIIGTATAASATSATVTFTAPDNNGGETITSYTAVSSPGGLTGSVSQSGSGTITVTGLAVDTPYTFTVYATNSAGVSNNSSASNQITLTASVPDAPTIGTSTATGFTTATVTYTAPTNNGGATITSYTAVSSPGGLTGSVSQSGSGTITIYGLTQDTNYTFTVYATNSVGNSSNSSASNQITTTIVGAPNAPTIGTATATGATTATVTYTESSGQSKYSTSFPGVSGSFLSTPSSTTLALGTSDFTIEFWFNTTAKTNSYPILVSNGNFTTNRWQINDRHASWPNVLTVGINNDTPAGGSIVGTTTISNDTWYHVALVRSSNTIKLYLNGVQEGNTLTFSGSMDGGAAQTIYVGQDQSQGTLTSYNGRISNLRIVRGVSVYTGAFTTPQSILRATQSSGTNISAITGTSTALLTCQSSTTVDNSTNNFNLTLNGTSTISSTAPVGDVTTYTAISSPGNIIGSVSQSGSGTITVSGLSQSTSYTFTVFATNIAGGGLSSSASNSITIPIFGQQAYTTSGAYGWVCPEGVTSVSVVAVGPGGTNGGNRGGGGGGGGLAYGNNLTVVPGQTYTVIVGLSGSASYFNSPTYLYANPGSPGTQSSFNVTGGGGGGAAGYSGNGGRGGNAVSASNTFYAGGTGGGFGGTAISGGGIGGTGGRGSDITSSSSAATNGAGGGAGGGSGSTLQPVGGGGVGILGEGTSGTGGTATTSGQNGAVETAQGGSGGNYATSWPGALYGGGSGAVAGVVYGGNGAVRIIWPGTLRQFPSTNTQDF